MSPVLTAVELAGMRAAAVDALTETCTIRRRGPGGWSNVATDVRCRVRLTSSSVEQAVTDGTADARVAARMTFPHGTSVIRDDVVLVGDRRIRIRVVQPDMVIHVQAHGVLEAEAI